MRDAKQPAGHPSETAALSSVPRRRSEQKFSLLRHVCAQRSTTGARLRNSLHVALRHCSRAAKLPDGNAKLSGLVAQIMLYAIARETHDPDREFIKDGVIALERRCFAMPGPARLERDLRDLAIGCPFGSNQFSAFRRAALQQHHVGMPGVNLVETVPD